MEHFYQTILEEFQTPYKSSVLVFAVILSVILLSPLLLKRIKTPANIGLIISGIVIGPNGFNLIEMNSAIDLFATIGLLYIMFIAGLELDLKDFRDNRKRSIIFGINTFIFPIIIGFPVCYYILEFNLLASILTSSMFATHTLVAYPVVSRLGISRNEAVAAAVGGTIITDTAVLVILAVVSRSNVDGINWVFISQLLITSLIFLLIVIFIVPRVANWFFKNLESEKNSHFIFVLFVVFAVAFLSKIAGLEPIIGAFAAGLALNKLIPQTSTLMNRIEFVGNSLFIPFFLISVGMIVNLEVLLNGPMALIIAITLTTIALAGKYVAAYSSSLILNFTKNQRNLLFGLSSSHAAATLAVILVGYNQGILNADVLNGTIILILITCMFASIVTESAGKKIVLLSQSSTIEKNVEIKEQNIIIPLANPESMERLIDFSICIKNNRKVTRITALSVVVDDFLSQKKLIEAKETLERAVKYGASADEKIETIATIDNNIIVGIKRVARERFATDIVIGFSGKNSFKEFIFGSAIQNIVSEITQTIFVPSINQPIIQYKRFVIVVPPFSEKEKGFQTWVTRIFLISEKMGFNYTIYATLESFTAIKNIGYHLKRKFSFQFFELRDNWDYQTIFEENGENTLFFIVAPRMGTISYRSSLERIQRKIENYSSSLGFVFIYPQSDVIDDSVFYTSDFDNNFLPS